MANPYNTDLDRNPANYQPLTPLSFLERAASVFPDHLAIVHGPLRRSYAEFYSRARQLASSLARSGIGRGDTVSALLANTPAMLECHYGVLMCGAVLHSINTRLDAAIIAFQLDHALSRVVIADREFMPLLQEALASTTPIVIQYDDAEFDGPRLAVAAPDYEAFLSAGDPDFAWLMPEDEWNAISINFTSGTTGDPKGVVSHHRGAYLLAQGNALPSAKSSYVDLSGDAQRAIKFDAEGSDRTVHLGMTKKELNRSEITGLPIDQRDLGTAQRMRAIPAWIEPYRKHPIKNETRVLSGRDVR